MVLLDDLIPQIAASDTTHCAIGIKYFTNDEEMVARG